MSDQQTRVTKVSSLAGKIPAGQSCMVVIYGPGLGHRFELQAGDTVIGRDVASDFQVDLDNVSRRHAKVTRRDHKVYVSDLGSTNGTFVNDREVKQEEELRSAGAFSSSGTAATWKACSTKRFTASRSSTV
jgi:pSer/pThr/pTyr-binding forkhead associated (FHA) protein